MKDMLKIWGESLLEPFKNVVKILTNKSFWKWVIATMLIVMSPIVVFYGLVYLFLIVTSFICWVLPGSFPIPFYHPLIGMGVDRFFILIGVIIFIVFELETKKVK